MIRWCSISPIQRDQKTNDQFNSSNPTPSSISCFQSVTKTQLEVCLKDIQRYDASHDPITVNYMAIGSKYKPKQIVFVSDWVTVKSLHYSIPIILVNSASINLFSLRY